MTVSPDMMRLLDDAVRNDFQGLRDWYFLWLLIAAVIVALGVVMEGPEIAKDLLEKFSPVRVGEKLTKWITLASAVGWVFVALGVAGEFVIESLVSKADALIQTFDSLLLTDAQKQTAFALADAESAKALAKAYEAQIAAANARAKSAEARVASAMAASEDAVAKVAAADARSAEASAKAERFRLDIAKANESAKQAEAQAAQATLELARFRAPRTLSPSQQASIASRLRTFGARRVDAILIGDAPDIPPIAELIAMALQQSGWTLITVGKAVSGPNISGVLIGTHIGSDRSVIDAADALISVLQSVGIASGRFAPQFNDELPMAIIGNWDAKNVAPIRMLIGAKP